MGGTPGTTALIGATVIDGRGGDPLRDATLVMDGGRIAAVGPRAEVEVPGGTAEVDCRGKHVVPGFIDVHVHYFEWMGEAFLAHGVTTVKDVGNDIEWIRTANHEVETGAARGPRILYTGNGLDVPPPRRDHFIGIENEEMGRRVVALLQDHGAIAIKIREMMTVDLLAPIVDEAHARGLKVTGHLRAMDARAAARAGIDGLEHASGIVQATIDPWLRIDLDTLESVDIYAKYVAERKAYSLINDRRADGLVAELAERDVALIPTMSGWWRMASPRRDDFAREDARYAADPSLVYVPDDARSIWETSRLYEIDDPDDLAQLRLGYEKIQRVLRLHHERGGRVLAGSDTYLSVPGLSLVRELQFLVDCGFSELEAISMATAANARFMGVDAELGTVEAGKLADVVVLDGDPLASIENVQRINAVYRGGVAVDRSFHADYSVPTPRPTMRRPLLVERGLLADGYRFSAPAFTPDGSGGGACC